MKVVRTAVAGLLAAVIGAGAGAQGVPVAVTSVADFQAAIGAAETATDTFSNDIPGGVEITFDSGVVSTLVGGNLEFAEEDNAVSGGRFAGGVGGDGIASALTLTWTFPKPVIGFVAEFNKVEVLDVTISGSGQVFDLATEAGGERRVFGLIDTANPFTQVQFGVRDSIRLDNFSIDNLTFAAAPTAADMPEPGPLAQFGITLVGLALACAAAAGPGRRESSEYTSDYGDSAKGLPRQRTRASLRN